MIDQETVQLNEATAPESEVDQTGAETPGEIDQTAGRNTEAETESGAKLVPVAEARRYRKRAQAAEKIAADLQEDLAAKEADLARQRQEIEDAQRGQQIDELLIEAGVVDLETARILTELTASTLDEPDIEDVVEDLRRRKPFLFRQVARSGGTLSPRFDDETSGQRRLDDAANEAGLTGRRQDLLRYLRLRRKK